MLSEAIHPPGLSAIVSTSSNRSILSGQSQFRVPSSTDPSSATDGSSLFRPRGDLHPTRLDQPSLRTTTVLKEAEYT